MVYSSRISFLIIRVYKVKPLMFPLWGWVRGRKSEVRLCRPLPCFTQVSWCFLSVINIRIRPYFRPRRHKTRVIRRFETDVHRHPPIQINSEEVALADHSGSQVTMTPNDGRKNGTDCFIFVHVGYQSGWLSGVVFVGVSSFFSFHTSLGELRFLPSISTNGDLFTL